MQGPSTWKTRTVFENHGNKLAKWYEKWLAKRRKLGKIRRPVFTVTEGTYDTN